jgi:hypothetical protein
MSDIDWLYLRRPFITFIVANLVAAALVISGYQFEKIQFEAYEKALSTLRTTHKLYSNIVNDIDLLDQYRNLYKGYRASGLVGKERRLSWIESLETTNSVLRLPTLNYNLHPQEPFKRPGLKISRGVKVNSSPMELTMGLLHEEDLFALLEGLRLSIKNLFTVDSCSLQRSTGVNRSLDTKMPNLQTRCTIRWVTIDAE